MELFVGYEQDQILQVKSRFDQLFGDISHNNEQSYFDALCHDIKSLNELVAHPSQETQFEKRAFECQEEYNQALEKAKFRWQKVEKEFQNGALIIKDLTARRKNYESSIETLHLYEKKLQILDGYTQSPEPWQRLRAILQGQNREIFKRNTKLKDDKEVDNTLIEKLETYVKTWKAQGELAKANTNDILKVFSDLDNLSVFLEFIQNAITNSNPHPIDNKILANIEANKQIILNYKNKCYAALGWRMVAAINTGNLRCDDGLLGLMNELKKNIFSEIKKVDLNEVSELLTVPSDVKTFDMSFNDFTKALNILQTCADKTWYQNWLNSRWVQDKDNANLIKVVIKDNFVIPQRLNNLIASSPRYTPDSWLRYWFFRTSEKISPFLSWIRYLCVGRYTESITYINETYRQLIHFESLIESYRKEGYGLNLNYIVTNPAFMASLSLPEVVANELNRGKFIQPSWFVGKLLSYIPFFNRYISYQFFSMWNHDVDEASKIIAKKNEKIAHFIVEDFEILLLNSIQAKSFTFDKKLISTLDKFINTYGSKEDVKKYFSLSNPINILQKFDFLLENKEEDKLHRRLNEDAVISFLGFAEKYWSQEKAQAIKEIIELINRENLPVNESEERLFMIKVSCLLGEDKQKDFSQLMNFIASKYIFETGDDGNPKVYSFLLRHAPVAAKSWKARRQLDIEDKFIFINKILTDGLYKELDLTSDELYGTGNAKLIFKNYAMYIADIQMADQENGTKYLSILIKQANKYLETYRGDNSRYADLISVLAFYSNMDVLNNYVKKRISYLFNEENSKEIMVNGNDFRMFKVIGKNPALIQTLRSTLEKQYKGDNLENAELILALDSPSITSLYFAKHFCWVLDKGEIKTLLSDKKLYQDFLSYPEFVKYIESALTEYINKLIKEKDWQRLEAKEFSALIEHYGTLQNKEQYRLLRMDRLIALNDTNTTKAYLSHVAQFLDGKLEDNLITIPQNKIKLDLIITKYVKRLLRNHQWQGHTQYFLEFFLCDDKKRLLFDFRVAWLRDYLAHHEKFADVNELERSYMEAKFHYQNKEVPHEEKDLESFYSSENSIKVRQVLMQALDDFDNLMNDEQIALLRRYFKDRLFTFCEEWPLFIKKFELYQLMLKIDSSISCGDYMDAIKKVENLNDEIQGLEELDQSSFQNQRQQIIIFLKKIVNQLNSKLEKAFKEMVVNEDVLDKNDSPLIKGTIKALEQKRIDLLALITKSKFPDNIKKVFNDIHENAKTTHFFATGFVKTLDFKSLHLIAMTPKMANVFAEYLSEATKKYLIKRIEIVRGFLTSEDPLFETLSAMGRLIENKYTQASAKEEDLLILSKYTMQKRNYPELANMLAHKLIDLLNEHKSLHQCGFFNDLKGSYQNAFIYEMSLGVKKTLNKALLEKIEWMLHSAPIPNDMNQRMDWSAHAKLFEWLSSSILHDDLALKFQVHTLAEESLLNAQKSLQALIEKFDNVITNKNNSFTSLLKQAQYYPKPENILDEKQLLKAALFVRSFGDEMQRKALDKMLQEVARRQRMMMMNGLSGAFVEYCLDQAGLLINLTGSDKQRQESAHLIDTWNRYRAVSLKDVRAVAILDAIPQYIQDFDSCIFQYFIKKYNLNEAFTQLMISKITSWQLNDELVEPNMLLKSHPISEFQQILIEQAQNQRHGFFYSGPSVNDAEKLFVAFCLTLQAHQLAHIWEVRQSANAQVLRNFKPEDISESLNTLVVSLSRKYKIGRGRFNQSVARAIHKDVENFASWSVVEADAKEEKVAQMKVSSSI